LPPTTPTAIPAATDEKVVLLRDEMANLSGR
jgi:hypothetical protein